MPFLEKAVRELTPAVIGIQGEIHPHELEEVTADVMEYVKSGTRIFQIAYRVMIFLAIFLPLFSRGKIFFWMREEARDKYLNDLFRSRFVLMRAIGTVIGVPIKMVYYNREEESKQLGFDRRAWKEEARLRAVTRDKSTQGCPRIYQ